MTSVAAAGFTFANLAENIFLRFTFQFHFFVVESHKTELKHSKKSRHSFIVSTFWTKNNLSNKYIISKRIFS